MENTHSNKHFRRLNSSASLAVSTSFPIRSNRARTDSILPLTGDFCERVIWYPPSATHVLSYLMQFQKYIEGCLEFIGHSLSLGTDRRKGTDSRSSGRPDCISTVVATPVLRVNEFQLSRRYGTNLIDENGLP